MSVADEIQAEYDRLMEDFEDVVLPPYESFTGKMAQSGAALAEHAVDAIHDICSEYFNAPETAPDNWPFDYDLWRSEDRRSDLIRAAAFIVAEIELMDLAERSKS
jgi:hypothetical protein